MSMRAVIELENGEIETIVGICGAFGAWLEGWLAEHPEAARVWCVMDELGDEWDSESEAYWSAEGE